MSDMDPKALEHAKRLFGKDCQLVKATDWSYTFQSGEKSFATVSKFFVDEAFEVPASEIRSR